MKKLMEGAGQLGIKLNSRQVKQFELYYQELIEGNKKINLTAITDYSSVQVKHFLDSLTITLALPEKEVEKPDFNIVDVGTGAGFPGVPLRILFPQPRLVLLEPTTKKTGFLNHIIRKLELENVEVLNARAEKAIAVLGGKLNQIRKIELEEFSDARYLVIIDKICSTPSEYPRRPGVP